MSDVKAHVQSIADNLTNPPWDEWNEGRDIDNEGEDYEEQCEEAVLEYLNDNTVVLGQCADGVVFQCF